jgi:hypothetical protein
MILYFVGQRASATTCPQNFSSLGSEASSSVPSLDKLLNAMVEMDWRLEIAKQKILKNPVHRGVMPPELLQSYKKVEALMDKLAALSEADTQGRIALAHDIDALRTEIYHATSPEIAVGRANSVAAELHLEKLFSDLPDLHAMEPNHSYLVPGAVGMRRVRFTPQVLQELLNRKLDDRIRQAFFQAIKNGITGDVGTRGIKLMKTSDKVSFAEVKTVGFGGNYRVYGCVEGDSLVFYFFGTHMESANDPQRVKLKTLCK